MSTRTERVFITGASSGIGAALAREYAARGATLGLLARRRDHLVALAASLPHPERHHIYAVDVLDRDGLAAAALDFIAANGGADVVIASAGISHGTLTDRAADLAVFDAVFATNVNATVATFAPFIAPMRRQATPCRLVGIGSVAGVRGMRGAGAYCASKAAVHSYCEALRVELRATNIRVVTIAPGYIDTPMTSKNRFPMPFLMPADRFAAQAAAVIARGDSYRVLPWQMGVVAKLLRLLPNFVFDRLFARAPTKQRQGEA
ncbi:short-subunit dehydrogenase [Massilia sp. UYP32]|uniref:Short chain dehydrogenase family protein n=1 Tax=Massilia timonae TaxID=47229 RepID=A0A1S2NA93_9BURK|nr:MULTISPECIES: SDR family oxidoreductase [Massilia]OIJ42006.1 short chain dehydrogenase family protein [Massilia timonae]QYG01073.1 SDR family oxidoreductase [Massilia sp. NP310]